MLYIFKRMHACLYVCTHISTNVCARACLQTYVQLSMHASVYAMHEIHSHTNKYGYMRARTLTHAHAHTHTRTHTHTQPAGVKFLWLICDANWYPHTHTHNICAGRVGLHGVRGQGGDRGEQIQSRHGGVYCAAGDGPRGDDLVEIL